MYHMGSVPLHFPGAYGTVYKAKDITQPTKYVALKKVRIPINEDGVPVSILREIALVRQLDRFEHPNIVRFLDVCHGPRQGNEQNLLLFLVFEFVEMDLAKYILRNTPDGISQAKVKVTGLFKLIVILVTLPQLAH